jgi:hypothetical protein
VVLLRVHEVLLLARGAGQELGVLSRVQLRRVGAGLASAEPTWFKVDFFTKFLMP